MRIKTIESPHNDSLKAAKRKVSSTGTLKRNGQAAAEGLHLAAWLAHQNGIDLEEVWVPQSTFDHPEWPAIQSGFEQHGAATMYLLPDALYKRLSDLHTPTGPLVLFNVPTPVAAIDYTTDILVLDGIQDPGNVGVILRNAAAAGVAQVVVSEDSAWPWSEKVLRAGMGAHSCLALFGEEVLKDLTLHVQSDAGQNTPVRVTVLQSDSRSLYDVNLKQSGVWVFGSEGQGVREPWLSLTNQAITIPQTDWVESLNVASSSAICFFEQRRQRLG